MEANEAPEKIYLTSDEKNSYVFTQKRSDGIGIEYIRTDAFIEKACEFLNKELPITDLSPSNMLDITFKVFDKESKKVFIEDFKKYMED